MNRVVIMTVGKTHSGKTTFARELEQQLPNSLVIDQDNHAAFINTNYPALRPKEGPNTIKYAVTQTIVEYAVHQTDYHLIMCNANRYRKGRLEQLTYYQKKGFITVLVHFDYPVAILRERIAVSRRSTAVFRSASTFEEVLTRQQTESLHGKAVDPIIGEADHLFAIKQADEVQSVIQSIVNITEHSGGEA